jgi:hypothetical protein
MVAKSKFGAIQIGIIVLALATALIHLALGIQDNMALFILNAIGYTGLVAALYLPMLAKYHGLARWALIAFTAVTVIAWVAIGMRTTIAYVDKIIELALIALLFIEARS